MPRPEIVAPPPNQHTARRRNVLIIDDRIWWRSYLCHLLQDEYEVTCVGTYKEAFALIVQESPHVIITDTRLENDPIDAHERGLA